MLPPEPAVLACRQGFADAQAALQGVSAPIGFFQIGWYGTDTSDERGSFGIVNPLGPLAAHVGDFLAVKVGQNSVAVYVIGSLLNVTGDLVLARRAYLEIGLLAADPIEGAVSVIS